MNRCHTLLAFVLWAKLLCAQEAASGVDVHATLSAEGVASNVLSDAPRSGAPVAAAYRAVVYPTIKWNEHWAATAALQSYSRPYFAEGFSTPGYGIEDNVLQAVLAYSRVSEQGSVLLRAGELSTAFGSFLLHYDDAENALVGPPPGYGYYYQPVSTLGVAGAQADVTRGRWDGRLQFANSFPANPRSLFGHDQYANWVAGGGYTIRQGLRVGVSAARGPYLYRGYPFYFPGEANPNTLKARAAGLDAEWSRGHWITRGEWQTFVFPYRTISTFREQTGYAETRRALGPRWYGAARAGYTRSRNAGNTATFEGVAGFRPGRLQVIKLGYTLTRQNAAAASWDNTVTVQMVTSLHVLSFARR